MPEVTVAIPVRNGGELFGQVLAALARQTVAHELLVCDSGSGDGTPERAHEHGARVLRMPSASFSHGGVRNMLMQAASGKHVAMLTQDAVPADERWLERLLGGVELAPDIGLAYGPYWPRPDAPAPVRLELARWFRSLSPDGHPSVERLTLDERSLPAHELLGRRGFFTDANACLSRAAWLDVPYRDVAYAEDRALALDMMRAGYAKAYVPAAAVFHSHAYTTGQQLRRSFDESRGLLEIYDWREPASLPRLAARVRGAAGQAHRDLIAEQLPLARRAGVLAAVASHELASAVGGLLGSRADLLPARLRRMLSLDGRA
jgi:rhamnosyltransferase